MGSSSPLVCHSCWEKEKKNWFEPCPHALEVFEQGVRKGRATIDRPPEANDVSGLVTITPDEAKYLCDFARQFRTVPRDDDGMITVSDEMAIQLALFLERIAVKDQTTGR